MRTSGLSATTCFMRLAHVLLLSSQFPPSTNGPSETSWAERRPPAPCRLLDRGKPSSSSGWAPHRVQEKRCSMPMIETISTHTRDRFHSDEKKARKPMKQ